MRVAIVEDDKSMQQYVMDILGKEGIKVDCFDNGETALEEMKRSFYNVVILDLNLPGMNGFDILYFLKRSPDIYGKPKFVMLTSRSNQKDINKGLKLGADDYIRKPFDEEELLLRINILLKRAYEKVEFNKIWYKDVFFDFEEAFVVEDGVKIELKNKENEILNYLIVNQGIILSKKKIYREIWSQEYKVGNKNLEAYLSKMKKKIKVLKDNLENHKNLGYRLKNS